MTSSQRKALSSPAAHGLLGEARVRLLDRLCGAPQTAAELGEQLGISANAVRVHLDGLRRAGLVEYRIERRGVGKPRHVYLITPAAEYLLSAAYAPALVAVLEAAAAHHKELLAPVLEDAGRALFRDAGANPGAHGVSAAATALESLGRPVSITTHDGADAVVTQCCPLGAVSRHTRHACVIVEAMLTAASGRRVYEACERGDEPRCRFVVG